MKTLLRIAQYSSRRSWGRQENAAGLANFESRLLDLWRQHQPHAVDAHLMVVAEAVSRRTAEVADGDAGNIGQVLSGLAREETTAPGDATLCDARFGRTDRIVDGALRIGTVPVVAPLVQVADRRVRISAASSCGDRTPEYGPVRLR